MANIRLKELIEANIDPKLVARSKESGKLVYFKSPEAKAAAMKAGSHEEPKKDKKAQAKQAAQSADMFKGDYSKERGAADNSNWMDNLDSIDTSDIKGKADPNADSFTSGDLYGATFKDPQTGKTITVGDAYEREDDSPAYQKAFAYVSKFDPDKEAVMGTQAYDDLNKKEPSSKLSSMLPKSDFNINPKNWKVDKEGRMKFDAAMELEKILNSELGVDGGADTDFGGGTITYLAGQNERETQLYIGKENGKYMVSIENPYGDTFPELKKFKTPQDAVKYAIELAKKYKKDLGA